MYDMIDNNPVYKVLWLILAGVLLYGFVRLLNRYVLDLIRQRAAKRRIENWRYPLLLAVWVLYSGWALYQLIKVNFLVTLVFLGAVFLAGFKNWMQAFSGLLVRLEQGIREGDTIRTEHGTGKIERFRFLSLVIKTEAGERIHVPYHDITGAVFAQQTDKKQLIPQTFRVERPHEDDRTAREIIKKWVESCPWTVSAGEIQVRPDQSGGYIISARAIDASMFYKLEAYVRRRLPS